MKDQNSALDKMLTSVPCSNKSCDGVITLTFGDIKAHKPVTCPKCGTPLEVSNGQDGAPKILSL